jgi:hypothetical protein
MYYDAHDSCGRADWSYDAFNISECLLEHFSHSFADRSHGVNHKQGRASDKERK